MSATGIGASVRRVEDIRFITGRGRYTDDINQPGQVYAVFLRSPYARAHILAVDRSAAMDVDGVLAVLTGREMAADGIGDLPCGWLIKSKDGTDMRQPPHPPLAVERVNYVGEPYGVVIANTLAAAREGADAVMTEFEELEAVVSVSAATRSAQIHDNVPANRSYLWELGDKAATDAAFARAAHVTKL
ncbi:MAG: xanthine dehydrogenase family protein molybdopterin-binding subunit, partial [Proteobacteria bacterium]|nr:xanthine dehydrogenase family protein molybdopterin-binding subunit [Pseudomonadota bacterium]